MVFIHSIKIFDKIIVGQIKMFMEFLKHTHLPGLKIILTNNKLAFYKKRKEKCNKNCSSKYNDFSYN